MEETVDLVEAVASLVHLDLVEMEQLTKDILVVITTQVVVHLLVEGVVPAELVQMEHLPHQVLNLDLVAQAQPQQYLDQVLLMQVEVVVLLIQATMLTVMDLEAQVVEVPVEAEEVLLKTLMEQPVLMDQELEVVEPMADTTLGIVQVKAVTVLYIYVWQLLFTLELKPMEQ